MANQVAYGFINLQHVFDQRVDEINVTEINRAIAASVEEHNRQIEAMIGLFVERTTDFKRRYKSAGVRRLQPGDEFSRAIPTRRGGYYDIAFPLQKGQDALGLTYESARKITVGELNDEVAGMLTADARWMRDHMLAAVFDNTSWTFTDDEHGSLTIKPLANGDSDTYLIMAGADSGATDTHYFAQTAAIDDATNPFDEISEELLEHPENDGEPVALIATAQVSETRGLADFQPISDINIRRGADSDVLIGTLGVNVPGEVIGYLDGSGVWVVHWRSLPSNYVLATTTGGNRPLAMREHPEAELQGFKMDDERRDYPWYEQQWARRAGFGGNNRVGALVYQVEGNDTTYDIPTNYTTPMP